MKTSLCLLTWNELRGCEKTVPALPLDLFSEVFSLDGGSSDGTIQFLSDQGIPVVPQRVRSYNAAYIEALNYFTGDAIVFFHPKGTVGIESLPLVVRQLELGVDLVVTSRMLPESRNEEDDRFIRHRKWFGQALAMAASIRWNKSGMLKISDPLHGYRGCSRRFASNLNLRPTGATADLEMVFHAYMTNAHVAEIPVEESSREVGDTHFPALKTGRELIKFLFTQNPFEVGT